ncbi:hypothetical protein BT93_L2939 [Corymbia citriodora subsp. variegata]|uniref:Uncharacterized protein n=1 Tax=Corymbia citriodora subsp. variegata TaxID=360336 RepID=A0A8T0CMS4_CORYI|nr:hypothetical protein BT93_L2939 [Corymbia citriodora subsp. variegata]
MSLKEQDQREDHQESFSFSNYDYSSSSFGVILSDGEDSDESYIEIELERAKSYRTGGVQSDDEDGEIELRISISSHVPFPQLSIPSFGHAVDATESRSSPSSPSTTYTSTSSVSSKERDDNKKEAKSKEIPGGRRGAGQFPAISRLLSMLISNLKVPPEICQENNVACSNEKQDKKTEMLRTRKPSSKTRTTANGGIMKFFIKLRAMQAKALLAPIMKTRDAIATDPKGKKRTPGRERKPKLEETHEFYRRMPTSKSAKNSSPSSSAGTNWCYNKSSSVRMNNSGDGRLSISKMSTQKSVAEALNRGRVKRTSSSSSSSVSCPSSIRCSPLHAGENSIQAAIVHCKNSFAPFPGFYF